MADPTKPITQDDGASPALVGSAFSVWEDPFPGWGYEKYARFMAYHKTHKWIWKAFEALALELIGDGESHWSADAILHVIRFQSRKDRKQGDEFLVNNDHSSGYSRAFARKYPQHASFFETRKCEAA